MLLLILFVLSIFCENPRYHLFDEFIVKYNKPYSRAASSDLYLSKFETFSSNLDLSKELSLLNPSAKFGDSPFMDLTPTEFRRRYLYHDPEKWFKLNAQSWLDYPPVSALSVDLLSVVPPTYWNWTEHGAVTPIKDQGPCGACWAFSTTGNLEGQHFIHGGGVKKQLVSLSEQQLIDCCTDYFVDVCAYCEGCDGGLVTQALPYAIKNGMLSEKTYPFEGRAHDCRYEESKVAANFSKYQMQKLEMNTNTILQVLFQNGPVSVSLDASCLQTYSSGILGPECGCSTVDLDHAVLLVGFGVENSKQFWIVKNSWGTSWGESGYFRMIRGGSPRGTCGIESSAVTLELKS